MNDCPIAVAACAQHAVQSTNVARWTAIFAASARLNCAKVAGVPKPAYPGAMLNGNAAPPAWRSVYASFINVAAASSAAWNETNGAGGAVIGWSTSSGIPNSPVRIARRWMCQAFIVLAKPDAAFTSSGDSPVAVGSAVR